MSVTQILAYHSTSRLLHNILNMQTKLDSVLQTCNMSAPGQTGLKGERDMSPLVVGKALLIPRVKHWQKHGWRAEIIIDDGGLGDVSISKFFKTREEAEREAAREMLMNAARYVDVAA